MRKSALFLAIAMIAAAPSVALAAKKGAQPADPNAAGKKFVREAVMQPVYAWQAMKPKPATDAKAAKKSGKKAAKKSGKKAGKKPAKKAAKK